VEDRKIEAANFHAAIMDVRDERARLALRLEGEGWTQEEIAVGLQAVFGKRVSQQTVSRILSTVKPEVRWALDLQAEADSPRFWHGLVRGVTESKLAKRLGIDTRPAWKDPRSDLLILTLTEHYLTQRARLLAEEWLWGSAGAFSRAARERFPGILAAIEMCPDPRVQLEQIRGLEWLLEEQAGTA
jgi:hypothetical protein